MNVSCNLFHREAVCGKNEYLYTSILAYGTKRFLSCDDLIVVVGAGGGMSFLYVCTLKIIYIAKYRFSNPMHRIVFRPKQLAS